MESVHDGKLEEEVRRANGLRQNVPDDICQHILSGDIYVSGAKSIKEIIDWYDSNNPAYV
jgi:hypothetical protein